MSNSVYEINKGINRSIEFKGLKAQYIWYLGGGIVALLVVFGILYMIGVPQFLCVLIVLVAGAFLALKIYQWSNKYGEHGMMKMLARRHLPSLVKSNSRQAFIKLNISDRNRVFPHSGKVKRLKK